MTILDHLATTKFQTSRPEPTQVEIVDRLDFGHAMGSLVTTFSNAGVAMLLLGSLHASYPAVPAASYWQTFAALYLLGIVGWSLRPGRRTWTKRGKR